MTNVETCDILSSESSVFGILEDDMNRYYDDFSADYSGIRTYEAKFEDVTASVSSAKKALAKFSEILLFMLNLICCSKVRLIGKSLFCAGTVLASFGVGIAVHNGSLTIVSGIAVAVLLLLLSLLTLFRKK